MFGVSDYGAFVVAIIVFLAIPGPGNLALLTATAKGGVRAGLAATLGVIVGDQALLWMAVAGVAALLLTNPGVFFAVQWLGAVYLVWLGARLLSAKPGDAPVLELQPHHYMRQAFVITVFNPKAIVFYMAFFPLFVDSQTPPTLLTFAVMALTIAALTFLYSLVLTILASRLRSRMQRHPWLGPWLQKLAGVVLVGFGLRLILQK